MAAKERKKSAVQVEVEELSPVRRQIRVEVPAARVRQIFDKTYRQLAKEVQLPGFRRGKAPRSVLERRYGATVAEEAQVALVSETLAEALEQVEIMPVSEPDIDAAAPNPDADFRYTASVEIKPVIALPDLAGLPARRPQVDVADAEVDQELERLRETHAPVLEEPEGTQVALEHILSLDFVGRIDGQPFEGGSGRDVEMEVGAGRFIPGFEEQLVGASSGEDREVRVTFPEEYGNAELQGKEAVFHVHVGAVKRKHVATLDDEFARDLGDFDSLDALRARVRNDLESQRERSAREVLQRSLVDALIERAPFDVPPGMIERQRDRRLATARRRLAGSVPEEALEQQLEQWKEAWRADAEREVREMLLLEAVAAQESLQVSDEDAAARISELASEQGVESAELRRSLGDEAVQAAVRAKLIEEKALEFLGARAKVEETTDS